MSYKPMIFLLASLVGLPSLAKDRKERSFLQIPMGEVRPLQLGFGLMEVVYRQRLAEMDEDYLDDLNDSYRPIIIGPREPSAGVGSKKKKKKKKSHGRVTKFLDDGHHSTTIQQRLGVRSVRGEQILDLSDLGWSDFYKVLESNRMVNLRYLGQPITPADLPKKLSDMKNDPYRSLAWFLRKAGGFHKGVRPFQEFDWADRLRLLLPNYDELDPDNRVLGLERAWEFSRSTKSRFLPGYIPESERAGKTCKLEKYLDAIEAIEL